MGAWRTLAVSVVWILLWSETSIAQSYRIYELPESGDCFRIEITTSVTGTVKIQDGEAPRSAPLRAHNRLQMIQRTLDVKDHRIVKAARYYQTAEANIAFDQARIQNTLRDNRRLIIAQITDSGLVCYSPAGAFTRDELNLAADHFDSLALTHLLPQEETELGASWKLDNDTVQAVCSFDGLISHTLTAKLDEVKDGQAHLKIEGSASGIENGSAVTLDVRAALRYDLLSKRLVALDWIVDDQREAGPLNPAMELKAVTTVRRTWLEETPKELSDVALVGVPKEDELPPTLTLLRYQDSQKRIGFLYPREWEVVAQTDQHVILRLLERGDFLAQATITHWDQAKPGEHIEVAKLKEVIAATPGWEPSDTIDEGEIPTDEGRWVYRVTERGEMNGVEVVHNVFAVASPKGDQVIVTFIMKPASAQKIGTRDVALVNSITFGDEKEGE